MYGGCDPARRGCFMVNTAVELAPHDEAAEKMVADHFRRMEDAFRAALERSRAQDGLGPNAAAHASYLVAVAAGLLVLARAGVERGTAERIVDMALSVLQDERVSD